MRTRLRPLVTVGLALLLLLLPGAQGWAEPAASDPAQAPTAAFDPTVPPVLSLRAAMTLAEAYNPGVMLARYQLTSSRANLAAAPANAATLAPTLSLLAQTQLGLTIPESAITQSATARQSQISVEQAAAQYNQTLQQIRLSTVQAYVEWQRAAALVTAQEGALERALTQMQNVQAALSVGLVARFDLLQAQAQTAGQQAALSGALAMQEGARRGLEQLIGRPLNPNLVPEAVIRHADLKVDLDLDRLTTRALTNRPDLRRSTLDLTARRLQTGLATAGGSVLQVQVAAAQFEMAVYQAQAEIAQAVLSVQGSLDELKAREVALDPAQEALRLAELRYEAGLATYLEVQSAFATALQAEAHRIEAASKLILGLARLAATTGDL